VAGPPGALIGAAVGGLAGGFAGKGIAEAVNPTEEDAFWRSTYSTRPYATGRKYEDLAPAYRYGWESRGRYHDRTWDQTENDLERGWDKVKGESKLKWQEAKDATRDAWNRVESNFNSDAYWRDNHGNRPYAGNYSYDDLRPAYRYGTESRSRYAGRRYEDVEGDLERGWDNFKGQSKLKWQEAKAAVREAFHQDYDRSALGNQLNDNPGLTGTSAYTTTGAGVGAGAAGMGAYGTTTTGLTGTAARGSGSQVFDEDYWRSHFSSRPYASGGSYEDYSPAYRYGWDARNRYQGRQFEDVENDLARGWDQAKGKSRLGWEKVKAAARDAWHGVERAMPGDADRDGR
jgi:hypothetical protein